MKIVRVKTADHTYQFEHATYVIKESGSVGWGSWLHIYDAVGADAMEMAVFPPNHWQNVIRMDVVPEDSVMDERAAKQRANEEARKAEETLFAAT
jgi:hypothetical protein